MKKTILAAIAAFAATRSALGQNQLQNPSFAGNLSGWTATGGTTASFSPDDANGSHFSGSAVIGGTAAGAVGGLKQCVAIVPTVPYSLVFRTRLVSGDAGSGDSGAFPFATYAFFSDAGCATPIASPADSTIGVGALPSWETFAIYAVTRPKPPSGAHSALVTIGVQNRTNGPFPLYAFDDVLFAPYRPVIATIPASASIHGQNGAFFQTDLWLVNASPLLPVPVTARHFCFAGQTCSGGVKSTAIPPRSSQQFHDAVGDFFGDPGTAGALEFTYDSALSHVTILSRTYSPSLPSPTTGSGFPSLEDFQARRRSVLVGLASNGGDLTGGFRTNVGVYNPTDAAVSVTVAVFGGGGAPIGTPIARTLGPNEPVQLNDVFAAAGAPQTVATNAYAVVESSDTVFSYATIIDNRSADSTIVTGQPDQTTLYP